MELSLLWPVLVKQAWPVEEALISVQKVAWCPLQVES